MIGDLLDVTLVFLIGLGAQLVDGTLGMGFGVSSASLLTALGFPPVAVAAAVNVAKIVTGLLSGLVHWRVGNVRRDWLLPLIVPGVVGGVAGAYLLTSLPSAEVRLWVSGVLTFQGALILWRFFLASQLRERKGADFPVNPGSSSFEQPQISPSYRVRLNLLGLLAGFFNSISGAYGPLATSAMMFAKQSEPRLAVGTVSLAEFFVAGAAASAFLSNLGIHTFPWELALALTIGGALTAPIAPLLCRRLPPTVLATGVGLALISLNIGVLVSWVR